ncbi:hypothetical protein AAIR98_001494 [Elusimicrobium simillimum]|uniref:hypothetical protein n=1 Tax=Elusimicrobium simillimum TaxID=3143438 RepID=UPI003C6EB03D
MPLDKAKYHGFSVVIIIFGLLFFLGSGFFVYMSLSPMTVDCKFNGPAAKCVKYDNFFYKKEMINVRTTRLEENYRKGKHVYTIAFVAEHGAVYGADGGGNIGVGQIREAEAQLKKLFAAKEDFVFKYRNTALTWFGMVFVLIGFFITVFGLWIFFYGNKKPQPQIAGGDSAAAPDDDTPENSVKSTIKHYYVLKYAPARLTLGKPAAAKIAGLVAITFLFFIAFLFGRIVGSIIGVISVILFIKTLFNKYDLIDIDKVSGKIIFYPLDGKTKYADEYKINEIESIDFYEADKETAFNAFSDYIKEFCIRKGCGTPGSLKLQTRAVNAGVSNEEHDGSYLAVKIRNHNPVYLQTSVWLVKPDDIAELRKFISER